MVIMVKIVKIGQLQMPVEWLAKLIRHSGFISLKRSFIIAEQKKLLIECFLWQPSSKKNPK
jgi:hypothetical protein